MAEKTAKAGGYAPDVEFAPASSSPPPPRDVEPEPDREGILAELAKLPREEEKAPPAEAPEKGAQDDEEAAEEGEASQDEGEADKPADELPEAEDAKEKAPAPAVEEAPQVSKGLEAIHRAEKRAKEAIARERQAFEKERADWTPKVEAAKRFEELKGRVAADPVGVLQELGVSQDDLEHVARQAYFRSKAAAQASPELRERAEAERKERALRSDLEAQKQQLDSLAKKIESDRMELERERVVGAFLDQAAGSASDDTPLVKNLLARNPKKARAQLRHLAERLVQETAEEPDPADVVAKLESVYRQELEEAGVPLELVVKPRKGGAPTKTPTPTAGEKRTATRTLSDDLGTPTKPRAAPKTDEDEREDIVARLRSGRLED